MLNIIRRALVFPVLAVSLACVVAPVDVLAAAAPNTLAPVERAQGFVLLFDGQSLAGWQHKGNWKVVKGMISRSGRGGSLVYV